LVGQRDDSVLRWARALRPRSQLPSTPSVVASEGSAARALWISKVRRYLLPRLVMPSSLGLPPVVACRGTSPSQAARSRARAKLRASPTAATSAVAFKAPIPGMVDSRLAATSLRVAATNSASNDAIRRSSSDHCAPHVLDQRADARARQ